MMPRSAPTSPSGGPSGPGSSFTEAPTACGFPPGTALEFAGRATTAELGVNEAEGDPLSDDQADIYVTRDAFDQGALHGRLVCAIFLDPVGFVEVTVHPDDVPPPTPAPSPSRPSTGIDESAATRIALEAADQGIEWVVVAATAGPVFRVAPHWEDPAQGDAPPAETWVWRVLVVSGDRGLESIIDFVDGTVLRTAELIVN